MKKIFNVTNFFSYLSLATGFFALTLIPIKPAQAASLIDFEGLPQSGACGRSFKSISTNGFDFTTGHSHICNPSRVDLAFNGTDWFAHDSTSVITMTEASNSLFNFNSFDLAEVFIGQGSLSLTVTGFFSGGGSVSQVFVTDGINDGGGSLTDFETFALNSSFSNLTSVTFSGVNYGLDNLVVNESVSVPETTNIAFLVLGTLSTAALKRKKKA